MAYYEGQGYTIRDAIDFWYQTLSDAAADGVVFREVCLRPHCSDSCPDEILLNTGNFVDAWSPASKIVISCLVILVSVVTLLMRVCLQNCYTSSSVTIVASTSGVFRGGVWVFKHPPQGPGH